VSITATAEFDPPPGDGRENPGQLGALVDGDPATTWSTVCYESATFGAKGGVGLRFRLSAPPVGMALEVTSPTTGWSARVFLATTAGPTLAGWGTAASAGTNLPAGTVRFPLAGAGTEVLLWLDRAGRAISGCTFPYQIRLSDVRVVSL
jgi:hypothetical protein